MKKLSVFLLTYNRGEYIIEAIEGILNQTYKNFDFYIYDNASTDNTKSIVEQYQKKHKEIIYVRNERNIGSRKNFVNAVMNCKTEYFITLHDDDIARPKLLEREIATLEQDKDIVVIGTNIEIFNNDKIINLKSPGNFDDITFNQYEYIIENLKNNCYLPTPTLMMKTKFILDFILKEKEFFDIELGPASDLWIWFLLNTYKKKMVLLSDCLYRYRMHANQDSMNTEAIFNSLITVHEDIFRRFKNVEVLRDAYEKYALKRIIDNFTFKEKDFKRIVDCSFVKSQNINNICDIEVQIKLYLLLYLYQNQKTELSNNIRKTNSYVEYYYNWYKSILEDEDLLIKFLNIKQYNNIAIWGNKFTSKVLVKDLEKNNINIVCIVDSNQGNKESYIFEKYKMINPNQIENYNIDCIIFSIENNNSETIINNIISQNNIDKKIALYSWKTIVSV